MNVSIPKLGDRDRSLRLREAVLRRDDEGQVIGEDHFGDQPIVVGIVADDAQFQIAIDQLRRNLARQAAADLHLDLGIQPPVTARCAAADTSDVDSLAPMISRPAELSRSSASAFSRSRFQVLEAAGVFQHDPAGVGQHQVACSTGRSASPRARPPAAESPARSRAGCAAASRPRARSSSPWPPSGRP